MEKLLDFKKDEIDNFPSKIYRFQCGCFSAEDAMDIEVMGMGKDAEDKYFTISMDFINPNFWSRLKYASQIIRGHWGWREFVIREEDHKNLSDLFNPDKKFSDLP